jgi:hypothetical protein
MSRPHDIDPEIADADRDSLHTLPLSIVPIETLALGRARMIKNAQLYAVVEVFEDADAGSGQIQIEAVAKEFGLSDNPPHADLQLVRCLGLLPSYDIYSLRILLRQNGIEVRGQDTLKLSQAKTRELTTYMARFTRPLIQEIYGGSDVSIQSFDDVVALFRNPDISKAKQKLQTMAERLGIALHEIPKFLEDYGDIFLSLSYYRQCLDQIAPTIDQFLAALDDIRGNYQLRSDSSLMKSCDLLEATVNELTAGVTGRFENFDRSTTDMWRNISAARFRAIEKLIKSYHTTIGGVLCSLTVKIDAWAKQFPAPGIGGPMRRSEFIMNSMRQGISNIRMIEDSAPMLSGTQFN